MSVAAWVAIAVLWVVVVCLAVAVLALARQIGVLHERLQPVGALQLAHGLKVGEPAPAVDVTDLSGRPLRVGAPHAAGLDTLVMFVSPTCPICKSLLPALRSIRRREQPRVEIVLASDGSRLEHADFVAAESLEEFDYVLSEPLGIAFGAGRLPHAVLIDGAGIVRASGLVNSREHLDSLFEARERGVATLQEWVNQARPRVVA
jgi:methylamine dehydrogenase accessory protein MauD